MASSYDSGFLRKSHLNAFNIPSQTDNQTQIRKDSNLLDDDPDFVKFQNMRATVKSTISQALMKKYANDMSKQREILGQVDSIFKQHEDLYKSHQGNVFKSVSLVSLRQGIRQSVEDIDGLPWELQQLLDYKYALHDDDVSNVSKSISDLPRLQKNKTE